MQKAKSDRLRELESELPALWESYHRLGFILFTIREEKLYLVEYSTFSEYCVLKWNKSANAVVTTIQAYEAVQPIEQSGMPVPTTKGEAKELGRLPEEERADAWESVLRATNGKPTLKAVKEEVADRLGEKVIKSAVAPRKGSRSGRQVLFEKRIIHLGLSKETWAFVDAEVSLRGISLEAWFRDAAEEMKRRAALEAKAA